MQWVSPRKRKLVAHLLLLMAAGFSMEVGKNVAHLLLLMAAGRSNTCDNIIVITCMTQMDNSVSLTLSLTALKA